MVILRRPAWHLSERDATQRHLAIGERVPPQTYDGHGAEILSLGTGLQNESPVR